MSGILPEAFVRRMQEQLGPETGDFLRAVGEAPVRGIRLNTLKPHPSALRYTGTERIPWTREGYYLSAQSEAGSSILHEAGAFYIQEPCAMIPAAVLNAKPGEKILDLCAAPGGKSTQTGCMTGGTGLLVCNEPVPKRAQILSGNIERMGLPNCVVTCALPEQLARQWPEGFDAVLADVPCSGEGMFRRDPETRAEWSAEKADGCVSRQREILASAAKLVRPGGRLVYSTCTYNPAENEENAGWFTGAFPEFRAEPFSLPGIDAPEGLYTCYPHRLKGEGQFTALFVREGNAPAALPADRSLQKPSREETRLFEAAFPSFPQATHLFGKTLISMPGLPDLKGIRTFRAGLHLGEVRGKNAVPDHAAAMCCFPPEIPVTELNGEEAARYLAGETVPGETKGWTLMRYLGYGIGWGKGSDGIIKNHYPKGLRNAHLIP